MKKRIEKSNVLYVLLFIIFLFAMVIVEKVPADAPRGQPDGDFSAERMLFHELGLSEDANDAEILALLDVPVKRILAASLVERRRIIAGIPKLITIVDDDGMTDSARISTAEALCTLGNNTWLPIIKAMAEDPNSKVNSDISLKYDVAGLLARAGDFSQFGIVEKGLADKRDFIRYKAMFELSRFAHPTDPVTDRAAKLLVNFAKNEPNNNFREYAIEGLEKLAKIKPALKQKVIEALEANVNSSDKNLQAICRVKLKAHKKPAEPNQ